ncbi:uncharacterized protein B0P05DRAFT_551662 [Gilbertella persicaria]|uniref:uncharacterized protein n=1 Tax=Gilbertella persicaria TaxID=101096 RepID=UPI00221EF059|nr:uncharacterized protein B0P05DRAFT_551662 [Gilbertella persicaria]KAI8069132.1 hypothetical protein B0P05DRAFT_551662 [Gilbertella persicaria]
MSQTFSLNLKEDKSTIRKIMSVYLKKTPVSQWKHEKVARLLIDKGLRVTLIDADLKELGDVYLEEANKVYKTRNVKYSDDEKQKMETLPNSMHDICTSIQVKKLFYSSQVTDELDENSITCKVQEKNNQKEANMSKFQQMNHIDKMKYLCEKFGNEGNLDFMKDKIASRFQPYLPQLMSHFQIHLQPFTTRKEREMLLLIAKCKSKCDIDKLLSDFYADKTILTPMCRYIRLALATSVELWSSGQLLQNDDNESWYRTHVYSAIWDNAFLHDKNFMSKRTDCYSSITKEFSNVKNQRVDFILRNINDNSDYLSTEEKPDFVKGKILQNLMLRKWTNRLGSVDIMKEFEAITCQWEGLKLIIFATRYISEKHSITYKKGSYIMPKEETHTASFARLLAAVLSLKRLVLVNYTKLNTVLETKHSYELQTMQFSQEDEFNLRSDSTEEYEAQEDERETATIDVHLESDILSALDEIETDLEEDIVTFKDWEEFMMERGRKRKNMS